jgi:hypothetical protein
MTTYSQCLTPLLAGDGMIWYVMLMPLVGLLGTLCLC